ncbi:MAG: lytic transglycosylase domain-containing protein [Treponema sp.]|nr:lytic transglycosylase domain-containing protein [Treponema sp.]
MRRIRLVSVLLLLGFTACPAQEAGLYEGIKKRHEGRQAEAVARFEKALGADNAYAASVAASELLSLGLAGAKFSPATMGRIRKKAGGAWAEALDAMEHPAQREKALALAFGGGSRFPGEAAQYALGKLRPFFTDAENAAIDGRVAASRSLYSEALLFFRVTLGDSPELFLRHPDLLADLGRAFQYTATGSEGMDLLLEWEEIVAADEGPAEALRAAVSDGSESLVRFRLLFYAARIARQRGSDKAIELFARALPLAPESPPEQADACIWYILDTALAAGPAAVISRLATYVPQWRNEGYFSDIMDKLARELVLRRQWNDILSVFALVQDRPGTAAKYAWIIGRAMEEGLFSPAETARAKSLLSQSAATAASETPARAYMRIAYNAGGKALYYRAASAAALGEPFLAPEKLPQPAQGIASGGESGTMRFLLGFFANNAAKFAPRYIRAEEADLSADELRRLAEALGAAGQYLESIRLISLYALRDGYQITRRDMELWHPRPFREQVGQFARETGVDAALLYGLIRTESAFDPSAVSRAGAVGLTQLMPATAEEASARIRRRGGPDYARDGEGIDLLDPATNIHIGASYLAYLNERTGDPLLALLAYNGGMNRVRRWRIASGSLPPDLFLEAVEFAETRNYGRMVMAAAAAYRELWEADDILVVSP